MGLLRGSSAPARSTETGLSGLDPWTTTSSVPRQSEGPLSGDAGGMTTLRQLELLLDLENHERLKETPQVPTKLGPTFTVCRGHPQHRCPATPLVAARVAVLSPACRRGNRFRGCNCTPGVSCSSERGTWSSAALSPGPAQCCCREGSRSHWVRTGVCSGLGSTHLAVLSWAVSSQTSSQGAPETVVTVVHGWGPL